MALIHEGIGTVVSDPSGAFMPGQNVVMIPNTPKYHDTIIKENYLSSSRFRSSGLDGFMQEYVFLDNDRVLPLPDDFNLQSMSFLEMVSVATQAVNNLRALMNKNQDTIGIWGDGNLGYITAALAKVMLPNSKILVFGKHQYKLDYFSFVENTILIDEIPQNLHINHAIECTGGNGSSLAIDQIINCIEPMGSIILLGVSEEPVNINTRLILERGLLLS